MFQIYCIFTFSSFHTHNSRKILIFQFFLFFEVIMGIGQVVESHKNADV